MADLGRQVRYAVGKETTPGTEASPTFVLNQLKFEMNPKAQYVNNDAAWGVLEQTNSSNVIRNWSEGSLEHKLTDRSSGLILLGAMGSVTTTTNADGSGNVKDHTFNIGQTINGQTLTFVRKDSLSTLAYTLGRIGKWELQMALDEYMKFTADVMAKKGTTSTLTPTNTDENEFVAKHFNLKSASTVAGLGGATNYSTLQSFTLTVDPHIELDAQAGSADPYAFSSRGVELSFQLESRYNDQTLENAYNNGTALAFQVAVSNTDVTIGTAANPKFVFTMPKVNITDWARSEDIDGPVTQKATGTVHYSAADSYALRAVLTNMVTGY